MRPNRFDLSRQTTHVSVDVVDGALHRLLVAIPPVLGRGRAQVIDGLFDVRDVVFHLFLKARGRSPAAALYFGDFLGVLAIDLGHTGIEASNLILTVLLLFSGAIRRLRGFCACRCLAPIVCLAVARSANEADCEGKYDY